MVLAKAKVPGWLYQDELASAQMNFVQSEYIKAIDGYGGGTYPNANLIRLTGDFKVDAGVSLGTSASDFLTVNSIANFNAVANFLGASIAVAGTATLNDITVASTSTLYGAVTVNANFQANSTSSFDGDVAFTGFSNSFLCLQGATFNDMEINGDTTIGSSSGDDLTINATIQGNLFINSPTIAINNDVSQSGIYDFIGTGRPLSNTAVLANANGSYNVLTYKCLIIPNGNSTRTYTLTGTAVNNDWFEIDNLSGNDQNLAGNVYGGTSVLHGNVNYSEGMRFVYTGGAWAIAKRWSREAP